MTPLSLTSFFFKDPAPPEIYTLSLHDALPIFERRFAVRPRPRLAKPEAQPRGLARPKDRATGRERARSEEHTSELQSHSDLVCRLLLEKKKKMCAHAGKTSCDTDFHAARISPR